MKKLSTTPSNQLSSYTSTQSLSKSTNHSNTAFGRPQELHSRQPSPIFQEYGETHKSFNASISSTNQSSFRNHKSKQKKSATKQNSRREKAIDMIPKGGRPQSSTHYYSQQSQVIGEKLRSDKNGFLHPSSCIKTPITQASSSNQTTMRNDSQQFKSQKSLKQMQTGSSFKNIQQHSPVTRNESHQTQNSNDVMMTREHLQTSNYSGPFADVSNRPNFSCIIMKSNEKVRNKNSESKENRPHRENIVKPITNFGQHLEDIEAEAQFLKRSMLDVSNNSSNTFLYVKEVDTKENEAPSMHDYKQVKRSYQSIKTKYQALLKEYSTLQHDSQTKESQLQRLNKEVTELRTEVDQKDNRLKQLKFENDKLFSECTSIKNNFSTTKTDNLQFQETQHLLELEQENFRKKIKRLTGELDVLETYYESLQVLIKQCLPSSTQSASNKLFKSLNDSIDYIRDLFTNSKLNVSQGKRVQRKIRYEKLKTEFQSLIVQMCQTFQTQIDMKGFSTNQTMGHNLNEQRQQEDLRRQVESLRQQQDRDKLEHGKRIEQYKEQVLRMRENIDLFKENMKLLKDQNDELQNKMSQQPASDANTKQMANLFNGLKEDNERLADEVKRLQEENFQLSNYLGVSKETIQNQNGIINGLQSVVESFQQQAQEQKLIQQQQLSSTRRYETQQTQPNIVNERSRSCNSSVEQRCKRMKPTLLHQSLVFQPSSRAQNLNHYQSTSNAMVSSPPSDLLQHFQSQTLTQQPTHHQMKRSHSSNFSQSNIILHNNHKSITQQFNNTQLGCGDIVDRSYDMINPIMKPNQTLNISNLNANILNKSNLIPENTMTNQQEQSQFLQESFIKYLAAEQKNPPQDNSSLDISQQIHHHVQGLLEGCGSPMTARFSSFQQQLQRQSKLHGNSINQNDMSRDHIKQNTKVIQCEIQDLDEEIVALQNTLFNAFQGAPNQQASFIIEEQPSRHHIQRTIDFDYSQQNNNNAMDFSLLDESR